MPPGDRVPGAVVEAMALDPATDVPPSPFDCENDAVAEAVVRRRREFLAGRHCARRALTHLGVEPVPILPGPHRAPRWPRGVVGSITHDDGLCLAAVAHTSHVLALGIDTEPNETLPPEVRPVVLAPGEVPPRAQASSVAWDRLIFSAKESIFKAWFPLTGRWLDFTDCRVSLDPCRRTFTARLTASGHLRSGLDLTAFQGRWVHHGNHLVTAVHVPATAGPLGANH